MRSKSLKNSRSDIKVYERASDINKQKLAHFKVLSSRNKEKMQNILNKMVLIRDSMMRSTNNIDYQALNTLNSFGKKMSNNLRRRIQFSNNIIKIYSDDEKLMDTNLMIKQNKSKTSFQISKEKIELKDFDGEFDLTKNCFKKKSDKRKNEKYLKISKQMRKLRKLKGEILMKDHKKKYSINKTFEPKKEVSANIFLREETKNIDAKSRYLNCFKPKILDSNIYSLTDIKKPLSSNKRIIFPNSLSQNDNIRQISQPILSLNNTKTNTTYLNSELYNSHYSNLSNNNTNNSSTKNNSRNIKSKFLSENRLFSGNVTLSNNYESNSFSRRKKNKAKLLFNYISNIENLAIQKGNELKKQYPIKSQNLEELEKSNSMNISEVSNNSSVDIKKINKEFGFDPNDFKLHSLNEQLMVAKNAQKVIRKIDGFGKEILNYAIKKMFYDDLRLNNKFYMDSLYERKLNKIKIDKEIKKLGTQALSLEKQFSSNGTIVPKNEKREILKILKGIDKKKWSSESLNDLIRRYHVFKSIHGKILKISKEKTRKILSE